MKRSVSSPTLVEVSLLLGMTRGMGLRIGPPRSARTLMLGLRRVIRGPALLALAFGLCGVTPAWPQEHEVPKAEILGGYSYLRSSDTNFNGWKATLVGNVNHWLGIAADFDGHYAGGASEHSITFGPHFVMRNSNRWTPVGYALVGLAIEKSASGEKEHGFATELGGGLDYEINHQWAVRVLDVTASITHVGAETHVSPKLGFGVILNLGVK
jgi:hypothetical protein